MADIEAGKEYKVVGPSNLHRGKIIVVTETRGSMALALMGESHYPFLPGELEPLEPVEPKAKRATPARRARVYKELLERVSAEWQEMPEHLRAELAAALAL